MMKFTGRRDGTRSDEKSNARACVEYQICRIVGEWRTSPGEGHERKKRSAFSQLSQLRKLIKAASLALDQSFPYRAEATARVITGSSNSFLYFHSSYC